MDLSSNFLMGLSLQFFVEVERKKKLRMVYLQVFELQFDNFIKCLSSISNPEQPVEMRSMPHQASRAFSAKLADVLGRVFQGVESSVPQVGLGRNPALFVQSFPSHRS